MELTENALKVLKARYLVKDEKGNTIETPEQMFRRVASNIASAEKLYGGNLAEWEERFYTLMEELKFLPNSPALMNAGRPLGQIAACFVLPVADSMEGIFGTLKNAALILQSGGGTGFSFSHLRPRLDVVRSTMGVASGPVSFMKIYNQATDVIKQGGARRGANMGILRVDHPDILEFIRAKRNTRELTNFNISVAVTDAFMEAVEKDLEYELVNPRTDEIANRIRAREVWDEIVACAWETGDPGIVFIDVINRANPTPNIGQIESTNPCGEQPLLPNEACVLGSINLSKYVKTDGQAEIDYETLAADIESSVRFLDNAIDVNHYPLPEIGAMHKANRKIGLGVMGFADLLILLGIEYDSDTGVALASQLMKFIQKAAHQASAELARQRGTFPNFKGSIWDKPGAPSMRNATVTTIAPTGTISLIADCSSGIEPVFRIALKRLVLDSELIDVNKHFVKIAKERGFYSEELMAKALKSGMLKGIKGVPPDVKRLFKTAHEISPERHIQMQAAFQENTDNAVSKTINIPRHATRQDVAKAYLLAYHSGCKGVTVFRYGTRKKGTLVQLTEVTNLSDLAD